MAKVYLVIALVAVDEKIPFNPERESLLFGFRIVRFLNENFRRGNVSLNLNVGLHKVQETLFDTGLAFFVFGVFRNRNGLAPVL